MPYSKKREHPQIVLLATGAFAVPSMRAIADSGLFEIQFLMTSPLHRDRAGKPIINPARQFAMDRGILISGMDDVHSWEFHSILQAYRPDILFVCDYGYILPATILRHAIMGGINLHGSLLPKYRGAAPVHWAMMNGEPATGVSVIHMTPEIDAGPVIAQSPLIPIQPDETVEKLEDRLAEFGADLVMESLRKMVQGETVRIIEQLHHEKTAAPRLKKEHGRVNWHHSSQTIFNYHRAMSRWPKTYTDWQRNDGTTMRLILGDMKPLSDQLDLLMADDFSSPPYVEPALSDAKLDNLARLKEHPISPREDGDGELTQMEFAFERPLSWTPGLVLEVHDNELIVVAGQGTLKISSLQPAGKRMMSVREFLRGHRLMPGDRFV